jgi:SAM-dependent methyltransferase
MVLDNLLPILTSDLLLKEMENFDRKKHWENIYQTKQPQDVSWFQTKPDTSLNFFKKFQVPLSAKIIDVGGGDSLLVDNLLDLRYKDITVLDISEAAIDRAKRRLGIRAKNVKWVVGDILNFQTTEKFDVWHDRAAFHFLTEEIDIKKYVSISNDLINNSGILVIGTFSETGPRKCSGIEIRNYSKDSLSNYFEDSFQKISCISVDHQTPFETIQNFVFCSFRKL